MLMFVIGPVLSHKALKLTRNEFGGIKSRVEEIGLNIGSSTPPNLSRAIEDLTKLGVEENLRKHMNRYENLIEYFEGMKEDLKQMCNKLYRIEELVNGLQLEGLVDFWRIRKQIPLHGDELECMSQLMSEHRVVIDEFIKLEEKVERTRERIKLLMQQENR
ncbi:uncharacterized protein LOC110934329 [Helianthus annuus]|uniref:uncharacterized protein LOC110934329 n=1 Tax=Helianthus annuus TaxID=4232 RepID=UPI000B9071B4|nr:uncharacterized protein LOC110934329 [Helianthus annuus]